MRGGSNSSRVNLPVPLRSSFFSTSGAFFISSASITPS
jgi:hypothetical protein